MVARFIQHIREDLAFVKGNYAVLVVSWLLMDFAMEIPAVYYALYVIGLGASETIVGLIGFCHFIALASMQFPGGYIADKFGRKWIICTMTFGVALSYLFFALAPSWHFILVGSVLMAVFNSMYQPALMAMLADSLPPEKRGMGFGIVSLIGNASTTPGPIIAAYLCGTFGLMMGMRMGYGLVVTFFLAAAFLRLFYLKETFRGSEKPSVSNLWRNYPIAVRECLTAYKKASRSLLYLVLAVAIGQSGFSAITPFLPVYAVRELLINETLWGLLLTIVPVTTVVFSIPIGKLIDKASRKISLIVAYVLFTFSIWFFVNGSTFLVVISLILVGAGQVMMYAGASSLIADLTPRDERGKINALSNFLSVIFMALGNLAGGSLYEHVSPKAPFYLAMTLSIPLMVMIGTLIKEPMRREE
ncbi:MAG: MFS transporter [Candidatus Nezhaarchaeales archaeon]